MEIRNFARALLRVFNYLTRVFNWIGYISLSGIVLVTSIDVIGRYFLNKPLLGSLEILELSMTVLGGFAILYTTTQGGHISVDLFYVRFPKRIQAIIDSTGSLLGFATWGFIAYQVYLLGMRTMRASDSTNLLHIPIAPFQFVLSLGLALYSLALLIQGFLPMIVGKSGKKEGEFTI